METLFAPIEHSNIPGRRDNLTRGYVVPENNQAHALLTDLMDNMTSHQLFMIADYFESQSMAIRSKAVFLAHKSASDAVYDRRREYVAIEGPRAVRRFLRQGKAIPDALTMAADVTGIRRDTIEWHWRRWLKLDTDAMRAQRDNLIYDMAQCGQTDATIAKAVALHEKSVNRILKNLKKQRGLVRPAALFSHENSDQAKSHGANGGFNAPGIGQGLAGHPE